MANKAIISIFHMIILNNQCGPLLYTYLYIHFPTTFLYLSCYFNKCMYTKKKW